MAHQSALTYERPTTLLPFCKSPLAWPRLSLASSTTSALPLTPAAFRYTIALLTFDNNIGTGMAGMMTTDLVAANDKHCWSVKDWPT